MDDDLDGQIARERWALRVLARHQDSRPQIEAAGRHCLALGRLLRQREKERAASPPEPAAQVKTTGADPNMSSC